jgi:hypothetical protein
MPEIPAPAHVLHALAPLWPLLYTALEWATQQTRVYFDAEGAPLDRHFAPSLVRYQAKRQLARLGHDAQEEEGEAYTFQTLPNNGLSLSSCGDLLYVLRILKALEGQLPAPGASRTPGLLAATVDLRLCGVLGRRDAAQPQPAGAVGDRCGLHPAAAVAGVPEGRGPNPGVRDGLLDDRDPAPGGRAGAEAPHWPCPGGPNGHTG